ncbi:MAG: DUF3187 family protein [Thermodesulfobacteriota bacterium]
MIKSKSLFLIFLIFILSQISLAHALCPFFTQNQSPLIQIYGLPSLGSASLLPHKKGDLRLTLDYASNYVADANNRETLLLDGESARFTIGGKYGLQKAIEVGLEIPLISWGGGFLDDFIINYHSSFGFPQGGRDQASRNRLLIRYEKDGQELLKMPGASSGIGDIKIYGAWQIYEQKEKTALSLNACLKLPTGNSEELLGSGSLDFSLWINGQQDFFPLYGKISFLGALGIMFMTSGNVLPDQQEHFIWFGSAGIGWRPWRPISFKVQINGHSSFYKGSDLRELNAVSAQIVLGGTIFLSERFSLDLGVGEDLIVKTSPDVVFHLSGRYTF